MKVVDIANEIYIDAGSPSSTSIPAIAFFIRAKVGEINNLLFEDFLINSNYEIVDGGNTEITPEAVSIIKKIYKVYDYELQIRAQMSAIATDSILSVSDQGSSVTKMNRNEVSKTLASIRKDEIAALNNLVNLYKQSKAVPSQITGDDTVEGRYNGVGYPNGRDFYY